MSEKKKNKEKIGRETEKRALGTQLGLSCACGTSKNNNKGLERCSGFQNVHSILVSRTNMDIKTRLNKVIKE